MDESSLRLPKGATLFVASIGEPSNNDLRVVVVEGKARVEAVQSEFGPAFQVEPDATCRAFEITWWRYIAYSVRNESFFKPEEGEVLGAGLFGTREQTAYLDYVGRSTFASDDYPGPLVHWFLYAEWHCIDVVTVDPPEVREISISDVKWDLQERPPVLMLP